MPRTRSLRSTLLLAAAIAGGISLGALLSAARMAGAQSDGQSPIQIGYRISPVSLDMRGRNPALVGLGSYIANAQSGCNDCHVGATAANKGLYLAGGRTFGPGVTAPDITPDDTGMPNGLTLQQFLDIMHTGQDPDGSGRVMKVMPWEVYRNMTDRDLIAIYEYVSAVPSEPGPR